MDGEKYVDPMLQCW